VAPRLFCSCAASSLIGHSAQRGVATIAGRNFTGAGVDLLRKVKLAALRDPQLLAFADDFFPDPPRTDHFQPEPGCSAATFRGSDAQVAALTGTLLTHALALLSSADGGAARAVLVDLGLSLVDSLDAAHEPVSGRAAVRRRPGRGADPRDAARVVDLAE
jgi:hypothetical protein